MRFLCAAFFAAFLATGAHAAELEEGKDWRYCSKDDQCVLVDGLCGKTAVNWQVKDQATAFYAQKRKGASCVSRFWEPKEQVPRCYMGGCDAMPKQAADGGKR